MCALINATFSAFFSLLQVILWWERPDNDNSFTLKDDSLSVLHSQTQPMSLYSMLKRSIISLSLQWEFHSKRDNENWVVWSSQGVVVAHLQIYKHNTSRGS